MAAGRDEVPQQTLPAQAAHFAFADAELSEMARSFYADNKRVGNQRIKSELGVSLRYPDYKQGLAALAEEARGRGT